MINVDDVIFVIGTIIIFYITIIAIDIKLCWFVNNNIIAIIIIDILSYTL